jgi:hypothetical protein
VGTHIKKIDTIVNNTPIYQSGSYLKYFGVKVELTIKNKTLVNTNYTLIKFRYSNRKRQNFRKRHSSL